MRSVRRIFLGYQFQSNYYDRATLLSVFEEACEIATETLRKQFPGIDLDPRYAASKLGEPLSKEIIGLVRGSSATVFELSDNNPNVMYELGITYGQGFSSPIILRNQKAKKTLASDIKGVFYLPYKSPERIQGRLAKHIAKIIRKQIEKEIVGDTAKIIRSVWAGSRISKKEITIICPELPPKYRPSFADPRSSEYVELASYGDLDALVELLTILPVLYPESTVNRMTSKKVVSADLKQDLIILGGPDFNSVTNDFMQRVNLPIRYKKGTTEAEFENTITGNRYKITIKSGRVHQDYGLFARFPNPLNQQKYVVMIGGLETFGVLGAARTFGFNSRSKKIVRSVLGKCGPNPRFATLLKIPVFNSCAGLGQIDYSCFHTYPWDK